MSAGESAAVLAQDCLCKTMQTNRPRIVSHSSPRDHDAALFRFGQLPEGWETLQELTILDEYATHLGLLEHHLGEENPVRVTDVSPRKFTAVAGIPAKNFPMQKGDASGVWCTRDQTMRSAFLFF